MEANYPISIAGDLGNDNPGIIDLGPKYRFLDFNAVKIGAGLNVGVLSDRIQSFDGFNGTQDRSDFRETNWLFQPILFSEFQIAGIPKLRSSIGLGYTFINSHFAGRAGGETFYDTNTDSGFNFNVGLSYDLNDKLFVQRQYDFIKYKPDLGQDGNLGFLKFRLGFRF